MVTDLKQSARQALEFVPTSGVDGISQTSKEALKYGLENRLFTKKDVDAAQEQYRQRRR